MEPKFESPTLLEIDHRAVIHNARRTIKSVESVLVELITNSDDAYKREGTHGGEVGVYLALGTGKEVNAISVWDAAGGIEDLEAALKYGSRHSSIGGATMPKRGYHGRGLKEAIIALGTGWIRTIHKGIPSEVQVNVERSQVLVRKAKPPIDTSKWRITGDGTEVLIRVDQHKKWPLKYEPEKFSEWLPRHFELRDIVNRREVTLLCDFYSRRGQSHIRNKPFPLRWKKPPLHYLGEFSLSEGMVLKLYESEEVLEVTPDEHYSIAGILITAGGVPVDLHIFDKSHPGSHYFYGELEVPSLLRRLRSDEADELRTDRGGLDWRREECTVIEREVRDFLKPHYERRATSPEKIEDRKTRESLETLRKGLNEIAKELLISELGPVKGGTTSTQDPSKFEIRPKFANELPGNKRAFTIYAPKELLLPFMMHSQKSVFVRIRLTSDHPSWFKVLTPNVELRPSKKYENFYTANAEISIDQKAELGAQATVIAEMGEQRDSATIRAENPRPVNPSRGLFNEITPDAMENPSQPVFNDIAEKKMIIYTRFPGVAEALGVNMDRAETERGATLLGDLVTEGLCRRIIQIGIDKGLPGYDDSSLGTWRKYDELRKLALPKVHALVRDIYLRQK